MNSSSTAVSDLLRPSFKFAKKTGFGCYIAGRFKSLTDTATILIIILVDTYKYSKSSMIFGEQCNAEDLPFRMLVACLVSS